MNDKIVHCEDSRLEVLLSGDEGSDLYLQSSTHVESCERCQQRLTQLAGADETWHQVGELLGCVSEDEMTDVFRRDGGLAPDPFDRQSTDETAAATDYRAALEGILEAPSHPELLGRLGRYEIERVIGAGGMGIVLRGFDSDLNRPVAIKILARHLAHSGAARQRFARESRAAAAVVHEHVVAIHNVETRGETPFLVMQYVAGESLQERVNQIGPLDAKEVLRIGIQAAAGLHAAHEQGVIHRDIKPANILLEHGVDRALVTDFGLARTVDDASLTQTGIVAGTPHYMSPEQANGRETDLRTDLFSLGAVLYFMATGRPPFRAEHALGVLNRICHEPHRPLWRVNPEVPDELSEIVDRLLEKKPKRRFASAAEAQSALTHCLARLQQRGPRRHWRLVRLWRRNRTVVATIALAVTAAVGLLLLFPAIYGNEPSSSETSSSETSGTDNVVSTVPASEERQFSVETWQQASAEEQLQWQQSLQEVDQALTKLQTDSARTDAGSAQHWDADVQDIQNQLNQMQNNDFLQP